MYQYPYGNAQQLNLDWILSKLQELEAGSTAVNIEEVANALISASFDAGVSYRRYDYCFYNGKLYRALNDTSGAFNPADWLEVVIGDDIPVLTRLLNAVDASLTTLQGTVGDQGTAITNLQNAVGDLDSDDVDNASLVVSGVTVTAALDTLNGDITSVENGLNQNRANIATIEGETASRTYSAGEWIIWQGYLCKTLESVPAGTVWTNQGATPNITGSSISSMLYKWGINNVGSFTLNNNTDSLHQLRIAQKGKVCEVHFYVIRTGGFAANTEVDLGKVINIALPPEAIRTINGCGAAAYSITGMAYMQLRADGELFVYPLIACNAIIVDIIYTID